jgi:hypothetical protein
MRKEQILLICCFIINCTVYAQQWPSSDSITKPWTRWWWLGSAVSMHGLEQNLTALKEVGIGGVEITPIYGIKGQENSFVPFLSEQWISLFQHTLHFAGKNGMGIDLANATGWPFGGPWVNSNDASKTIFKRKYILQQGQSIDTPLVYSHKGLIRTASTKKPSLEEIPRNFLKSPKLQEWALDQLQFTESLGPETVMAYGPQGQVLELTHMLDQHWKLNWKAPQGEWHIWALYKGLHGKMVERAAPGGEGYAIDHFSKEAVVRYLDHFTFSFKGKNLKQLRGYFNDSYEVDDASGQANWTNNLLEQFQRIKGYDLRHHLPSLFGEGDIELQRQVLFDYRAVIDSLILSHFTETWKEWGAKQGKILRNQSHGSPANTLDLYAAVDIPETEGTDWMRFKFATSAAHVAGKKLVSAEAATWLDEHFLSSWGDVKKALDLYFLSGVNHIVYHGTPYSAPEAAWPGWNFYAAVEFQKTNPQWKHLSQLNSYVTRIQSFLQPAKPDHQVLLYYPLHNRYTQTGGPLLQHFDGMERNFEHTDFEFLSKQLEKSGIGFDFVSDRQLSSLTVRQGKVYAESGNIYQTILVPQIEYMDLPAWYALVELAKQGATVVFHKAIPNKLPGLYQLEERKEKWAKILSTINWINHPFGQSANVGNGRILILSEWESILSNVSLTPGKFEQKGIKAYLMKMENHPLAFVVNQHDSIIDDWIQIDDEKSHILFFDPMTGKITRAAEKTGNTGKRLFRILLHPHESMIVKWVKEPGRAPLHAYLTKPDTIILLDGSWVLRFDEGGPILPSRQSFVGGPRYWTNISDSSCFSFSGLATYETQFDLSNPQAKNWQLDLGNVGVTAEIWINGKSIGVSIGPGHHISIPPNILQKQNQLKIQVANLMANRIASMDRNEQPWKIFYNINMSAKRKENLLDGVFDARKWSPQPSGLDGPVRILRYD